MFLLVHNKSIIVNVSGGKIPSLVSVFTTLFKNKHMVQSLPQSDSLRILFNSPE